MARYAFVLIVFLALMNAGCSRFGNKGTTQFLKPLGGESSGLLAGGTLDERILCLETAKAVAEKGHAPEAILLYEKAERLDPNGETLDLTLAPLYGQTGQTDKAVTRYQRVVTSGVADSKVYNDLAWTLIDAHRYVKADEVIGEGLTLHPEDERLLAARACVYYELGKPEASLKQFAEIYGLAAAHHNLAILELNHGKTDQAFAQLSAATKISDCPEETIQLYEALSTEMVIANQGSVSDAKMR